MVIKKKDATPPTIIVIFGVTGDLSRRKLIPALFDLEAAGMLPAKLRIIGFSRRTWSKAEFYAYIREVLSGRNHGHEESFVEKFVKKFEYCQAFFDEAQAYRRLGELIMRIEKSTFKQCANKLYYLAVPPHFYEGIFRELALSGLTIPCGGNEGWARILVEKPFGNDVRTAKKLDLLLGMLFKEEQIFRIDHYLAKEALQNLLAFRFSNALFEPVWNHEHIDSIAITLAETDTVGTRGAFYDGIGALKDVGQNHLLQMLSLIAMEPPKDARADSIRRERARVLRVLHGGGSPLSQYAMRGQYEGYQEEKGIAAGSTTETFFSLKVFVRNKRFRGVPFVLSSGKGLSEARTDIVISFKPPHHCPCRAKQVKCTHENRLSFRIQPNEGIELRFWIKKPGFSNELEEKHLSFSYAASVQAVRLPDAYERLLADALAGDQTLFTSTEEVQAAWRFIMPILVAWQQSPLVVYKKGTQGPPLL